MALAKFMKQVPTRENESYLKSNNKWVTALQQQAVVRRSALNNQGGNNWSKHLMLSNAWQGKRIVM